MHCTLLRLLISVISIYIFTKINKNTRAKIKDRVLSLHTYTQAISLFFLKCIQRLPFCFTYKMLCRYQVWSWHCIKNNDFRRFCDLSLFNKQRFELIYGTSATFRLHKFVNILQLPTIDIAAVLHGVCKYLFALSQNSPFVLYIYFYILDKLLCNSKLDSHVMKKLAWLEN